MTTINIIRFGAGIACLALSAAAQTTATPVLSPAEIGIRKAQEEIAKNPGHYSYYNGLAMAYARRARETSDVRYYEKAEETLKKSFAISPDNFEGLKVETWLQLGRHEFGKALELAKKLNKQMPDDITVYGYLTDANVELGNYQDAVASAQWMLNLRPGNVAGMTRAAYLRELHGNLGGAFSAMKTAYDATPFQEAEDRARLLTQLAHIKLLDGDLASAEMYANGALGLFPGYYYALGLLGQVREAQKRYDDAVALFEQRYQAAPHAENLYALAEALELAGRHSEAAADFAKFEELALQESVIADNANHELIAYYTDVAKDPAKALDVAKREAARRHDLFTLDSHAWALAASNDYEAADAEIHKALATGIKDPNILYHAGAIALHLNRTEEARKYLEQAASRYSRQAQTLLRQMSANAQQTSGRGPGVTLN
jgi:tetratricopeptide (TPR) repeat protein